MENVENDAVDPGQEVGMASPNRHLFASTGQMVDIGGFRLHALVRGQGEPVVVFEPALGGYAQQYERIYSAVSEFTQVMVYDRAGQGWSDANSIPRTPANLAGELNTLLSKLNLQPSYVLVGHSFGGLLTRVYAGLYPQEVAGLVLIDAVHVDEYAAFGDVDKFVGRAAIGARMMTYASRLGLAKTLAKLSLGSAVKWFSKEELDIFLAVASQPKHHETMLAEFAQHPCYFGARSEVPGTLGDLPLIVVTAGKSVSGTAKIGSLTGDQVNALHQRLQKDLVHLSTQGDQLIIPDATHFSIFLQPDHAAQVADAIHRIVETIRRK